MKKSVPADTFREELPKSSNLAKGADEAPDLCKKLACDIQLCLKRHEYDHVRCDRELKSWAACHSVAKEKGYIG